MDFLFGGHLFRQTKGLRPFPVPGRSALLYHWLAHVLLDVQSLVCFFLGALKLFAWTLGATSIVSHFTSTDRSRPSSTRFTSSASTACP